jgi:hypothetical protein
MRALTFVLCVLVIGCSSSSEQPEPNVIGDWGGTEASLTLSRAGGDLSYPCGAGTIDSTWTLSTDGHLAGTGQHFFGGGPQPVHGRQPHPAIYAGTVDGDTLILSVTVADLGQTLGPFRLLRGGPVVMERCV